jgi:O-antigen ligase
VWIGAVVGTVAAMISSPRLRRYLLPLAMIGLVALLAAFAFVPNLSQSADERANDDYSVWDRKNLAVAATNVIKDKPLFGLGWSTFTSKADLYFEQQGTYPLTAAGFDVHNLALGMFAELGLVGGTLWLAALVLGVLVPVFRRGPPRLAWWKVGFVAIVAQWLVIVNLTPGGFAFSMYFVWLWAGIVSTDHTSKPIRYVQRTWITRRPAPSSAAVVPEPATVS